jgi:hypothetical protein
MALEPIKLDDLTWAEMVLAIRRRIAAASAGKWTLHAPVDPGIAMLELFAWLLEQRVYWLDQVPDSLVRGAINLLGDQTRPARPAATVLRLSPTEGEPTLNAGTEMRLASRIPPIIFSTESDVTLLPVAESEKEQYRVSLFVGNRERTQDLLQQRIVHLFPSDGSAAEIKIVLWLTKEIPAAVFDKYFSLLFGLDAPSNIAPHWSPDAVKEVPVPAEVTWWYRSANGNVPVRFPQVDDGTAGLRRSGVVRLAIPDDWRPEDAQQVEPPVAGLKGYALWLRVEEATFTSPPRLARLMPNVAIARHWRDTDEHSLDRKWLPLPGNSIQLSDLPEGPSLQGELPVKDHPPLEDSIELSVRERDGKWYEWKASQDLSTVGPDERFFLVDRQAGALRFGDGLTGRLPVLAKNGTNLKVRYKVGGGNEGNVGSHLEWMGGDQEQFAATNVVSADGGEESEPLASARKRVASSLRERNRAVTRLDYETIARTTPGIAIGRAYAAVGFHPCFPCSLVPGAITVFIIPYAPRERAIDPKAESDYVIAPIPDPGAVRAVRARLEAARLVASEVFVLAPRYRSVSIVIDITAEPVDPLPLRQRITERLQDFLDPLIGGDQKDGWPFGEPVRPSVLLREAQQALGTSGEVVAVYIGIDDNPADENCDDVKIGEHDLVTLEQVTVRLQQSASASGGLR